MRSIGMDAHRSFAQVAIFDDGEITDSFRVDMEHDAVFAFGRSLKPDDEVIREATGNTSAIVRFLTPFVSRAILHANFAPKYARHLFGKGGRRWLKKVPLPQTERDLLGRHFDELDWLAQKR